MIQTHGYTFTAIIIGLGGLFGLIDIACWEIADRPWRRVPAWSYDPRVGRPWWWWIPGSGIFCLVRWGHR